MFLQLMDFPSASVVQPASHPPIHTAISVSLTPSYPTFVSGGLFPFRPRAVHGLHQGLRPPPQRRLIHLPRRMGRVSAKLNMAPLKLRIDLSCALHCTSCTQQCKLLSKRLREPRLLLTPATCGSFTQLSGDKNGKHFVETRPNQRTSCGSTLPALTRTMSNRAIIEFHTDGSSDSNRGSVSVYLQQR